MTSNPVPPAPGLSASTAVSRARWLAIAGVLLCLLGGIFYWGFRSDLELVRRTAAAVDAGQSLTPEQRLTRYVHFASSTIRNPRYSQLPSGVRFYYRWNPLHPGAGDVLRWGSDYRGGCGSHVRVVMAMLQASGLKCRPLLLLDSTGKSVHTDVETWIDGRWVVADALYGIVFRRRDGALATTEDVRADSEAFLRQVLPVPGYDAARYSFRPVANFNWKKVPVVLPALRRGLSALLGEQWVRSVVTPGIWSWPEEMYAVLCWVAAVSCLCLSRRAAPRRS